MYNYDYITINLGQYCYLSEKSIILEEQENAKKKQMQLRKY